MEHNQEENIVIHSEGLLLEREEEIEAEGEIEIDGIIHNDIIDSPGLRSGASTPAAITDESSEGNYRDHCGPEDSDLLGDHELGSTISRTAAVVTVSIANMIEAGEYHRATAMNEVGYQALNGRLSPNFCTSTSYATLTPLQPLPPISTMSDKFSHFGHAGNVGGGPFTLMQNMNYPYEKLAMNLSPPHYVAGSNGIGLVAGLNSQQSSPLSNYSHNGLQSPGKSPLSPNGYENYVNVQHRTGLQGQHSPPMQAVHPEEMHSPPNHMTHHHHMANMNGLHMGGGMNGGVGDSLSPPMKNEPSTSNTPPTPTFSLSAPLPNNNFMHIKAPPIIQTVLHVVQSQQQQINIHSQQVPVVTANPVIVNASSINNTLNQNSNSSMGMGGMTPPSSNAGGGGGSQELEEINTKELAQRISAELKRYSIPQAIFAQRVLCRSQGTLSDLLRNPKPWSKLKSGRETFRRMWKWLQEPEFQRMSALRLAVFSMFS